MSTFIPEAIDGQLGLNQRALSNMIIIYLELSRVRTLCSTDKTSSLAGASESVLTLMFDGSGAK